MLLAWHKMLLAPPSGLSVTLPQPCWAWTGATLWIMSQCHQTGLRVPGRMTIVCMRVRHHPGDRVTHGLTLRAAWQK
jgi:hypothetical protein